MAAIGVGRTLRKTTNLQIDKPFRYRTASSTTPSCLDDSGRNQAFALRTQIVSDMAMFRQQSSGPLLHRPKALSFSSAIVGNYAAAVKAQNGGCRDT